MTLIINAKEAEAVRGSHTRYVLSSEGALATNKKIIDRYIDNIIMHKDNLEIFFNLGFHPEIVN